MESPVFDLPRITSFAEAMEVGLSKKFRQAKGVDLEITPIKADTITVLHGEPHLRRRIVENPLFKKSMLNRLELEVLDASVRKQISGVLEQSGGRGDLLRIARLSLLPLTAAFIGLDNADSDETVEHLSEYASIFAPAAALEFKKGRLGNEREESLRAAELFSTELFHPSWVRRQNLVARYSAGKLPAEDLPSDLITTLSLHCKEIAEDIALREAIHYIVASTDTTVLAVATTIQHLTDWLRDNEQHRGRLADSLFLQSAVFEAIRLHSPPALLRLAEEDIDLKSGRKVRAGERVMIDVYAANRDASVFGTDAYDFDPFRRVPEGIKPYGLGFGAGSYACIGKMMAVAHFADQVVDAETESIGSVLRIIRHLLDVDIKLDSNDPPELRSGWLQERYVRFPVILDSALATA